jgi:quercetin dioxygenase-like cupin family protein
MNDSSTAPSRLAATLPPDDPQRALRIARPQEDAGLRHIVVLGDTYTILVSGEDSAGRHCLIDMLVPPGGGPPPHRHDFEEMFTVLEGEVTFTFRGEQAVLRAGETVSVPANAPHYFKNTAGQPARMLCFCAPSGLEEFFMAVGDPIPSRAAPPPVLDEAALAEQIAKAVALAPQYKTEILAP